MSTTDPLADMLTRIRNASKAKHDSVLIPSSKLKLAIAKVFKEQNFIRDYDLIKDGSRKNIRIFLAYTPKKEPIITEITRVSKPGLRVYCKSKDMPRVRGGVGVAVVSTPLGIMTSEQARERNVGGEVLCMFW